MDSGGLGVLLRRPGSGSVAAGILQGEALERADVNALLDEHGNGLYGATGQAIGRGDAPCVGGELRKNGDDITTLPTATSFSPVSLRTLAKTPSSWNSKSI